MFVNDAATGLTVDAARGAVLRSIAPGRGRTSHFSLAASGLYLEFEARALVEDPDGDRRLTWTVHTIRVSHLSYGPNGHPFADPDERARILGLIEDALRACRGVQGRDPRPVAGIIFEAAALNG